MPPLELPGPDTPESIWKKSEEKPAMQATFTAIQLATMSRSRERLNHYAIWAVRALLAFCAGSALFNVFTLSQPWLRVGQVCGLAAFVYLFSPALTRGVARQGMDEPSSHFLVRQHEERRRDYLWMRARLYVCLPSLMASWWGIAQVRGLGAPPTLASLLAISWPFLACGAVLVVVWLAFDKAAEKAQQDADEIRRRTS